MAMRARVTGGFLGIGPGATAGEDDAADGGRRGRRDDELLPLTGGTTTGSDGSSVVGVELDTDVGMTKVTVADRMAVGAGHFERATR